ncbi:MAG TPA: alkaline phosphatase family protein [Candidatus Sulfotelmatobacter sp.]|jgi:phospholipase C|nr:alkaline phosphatase family protein [Candidatus Sulfotelmatobacter sp.]
MSSPSFLAQARQHLAVGVSLVALLANLGAPVQAAAQTPADQLATATPIKHVIVIIGENRSFDHVYATYVPKKGQTISNLLSKGIITASGQPGANYAVAAQFNATNKTTFEISPAAKTKYALLPPPGTQGAPTAASDTAGSAPFLTLAVAELAEPDLFGKYNGYLLTGATGLPFGVVDTRINKANSLPSGPFQITPGAVYDSYTGSPVHRFYQMWQQTDCSSKRGTSSNPSGCAADLFSWVEVMNGTGGNGAKRPSPFTNLTTGEGSDALGFYNVQQGDAPYMKFLADNYTLSDNMHQSVMGGTGANHIMFGFADALWYSDGKGHKVTPPVEQIENPNPQAGTNNWYDQDGYSGGSYTNCSDLTAPAVSAISNLLDSLNVERRCASGAYYLLNNYNPGFVGNGTSPAQFLGPFTIPPTSQRHIGDVLSAAKTPISYTYFGEGWDLYVDDPAGINPYDEYCNICNPFQYASDIMTNPLQIAAHIADTTALYEEIDTGTLPAVSIVKPSGNVDGHPASSKLDLFEGFVNRIVNQVKASSSWSSTAIFITFDEGGGYYDSGYIQPVDYFGDGTRIPLLIVSPYSTGGVVNHSYADHVSMIKFIERNWGVGTITATSRDNFPNPLTMDDPYVPANTPALDDLFDAFDFSGVE